MNLIKRTLPWMLLGGGVLLAAGCELIASVDHDLINQGSGGATSASSTSEAASSSSSSSGTGGSGGGCSGPMDCPVPPAECDQATCTGMMCGTEHKAAHVTCTTMGGKVCDGMGVCVGCVDATDCMGTDICSAASMCVPATCNDTMKNGDETDTDCGGSCGATCTNTKACVDFGDCLSGVCTALACIGCANDGECQTGNYCENPGAATGVCQPKLINGVACTGSNQCQQNNCINVTGGGQICCDNACAGGCSSCLASEKGSGQDGTCGNVQPNSDPKNFCSTSGTDCNTGSCDGGGLCGFQPTSTPCGTGPVCTSDALKVQDACDVAHVCQPGSSAPCASNFSCANGTMCGTSCSASGTAPTATSVGCATGYFCDTVPATPVCSNMLKAAAAACVNNYECSNGTCAAGTCN